MAYDAGFASAPSYRAARLAAGYVTLRTENMSRAARFYELIAREMGVGRSAESDDFVGWGLPGADGFGVALPGTVDIPQCGLVPLQVDDPQQVERLYEIAISNGGAGEGAPASHGGFFGAYFRDPDGNQLNAFCVGQH